LRFIKVVAFHAFYIDIITRKISVKFRQNKLRFLISIEVVDRLHILYETFSSMVAFKKYGDAAKFYRTKFRILKTLLA
jgi:hypothetical protein